MTDDEAERELRRIARKVEPGIRDAFVRAIRAYARSPIWRDISRLLREGRVDEAFGLITPESFDEMALDLRRAMREAIETAGEESLRLIERLAEGAAVPATPAGALPAAAAGRATLPVMFDLLDERRIRAIRDYELGLIREIADDTREGIRERVRLGLELGENPRTTARRMRDGIGLTARQQRAVANFRRMLEERDPEALTRRLRDRRFDPSIRRAIFEGERLPQEKIERMVARYRERYIKHRAEVIARTESLRAAAMGQQEAMVENIRRGPLADLDIRRYWVTARDERVRASHSAIPGLNAEGVPVDGEFRTGNGYRLRFPRDPQGPASETVQCRCAVRYSVGPSDFEPG